MRYAILGGDLRFAHLAAMLNESGRIALDFLHERAGGARRSLDALKSCDCVVMNWPPKWPLSERELSEAQLMENIAPGSSLLLCGPKFPEQRRWDLQYVNLWDDENLLQENAYLTAEAAVASAMQHSRCVVSGMPAAVVGYGRIGRALTEILLNLGSLVTVVSGSAAKRRLIRESGAEAYPPAGLEQALPGRALIFSTPPALILDRKALASVEKGALLIDLASPPYGVDVEAARELGLNAWREPGLPGRYCPLSAARVLYRAVIRWEEAEKREANES